MSSEEKVEEMDVAQSSEDQAPVSQSSEDQAPVSQSSEDQAPVSQSSEDQAPVSQSSEDQAPVSDSIPEEWGEDISPEKDQGVFKKILTPGSGTETPFTGDEVLVHYTGRLLNGNVFDSSVDKNEKFKFKLGQGQVIKGWDIGVATMTRGEKCLLTCKPEYAYGKAGSEPKIGPDETLQFEVELFDWRGDDVTEDGGVIKSILIKGDGYSTPEDGTMVEGNQCA